jgi:putative chitinase
MSALTPDDVRRWDPAAVLKVFQVASGRAGTLQTFGDDLGQVGQNLADWEGEAGAAFQGSLGRLRTDIEADGRESRQVASAVCDAWEDVQITKGMMSEVDQTAEGLGFTITNDWKVDIGNAGLLMGTTEAELEQQILQGELDTVKTKAHTTDHELAIAMRAAVGDAQLDYNGREIPQAPPQPGQGITEDQFKQIFPNWATSNHVPLSPADAEAKAKAWTAAINQAMAEGNINTPARQAAFLAEAAEETAWGDTLTEYADGTEYNGRTDLGNINPGDGPKYKGRGGLQLTGRNNYAAAGKALGLDLIDNPEQVASDPVIGFRTAAWFWNHGTGLGDLNLVADQGDITSISRAINGGDHGLQARIDNYNKILKLLGAS